jgi:two-component system response regulator HydG
MGTRIATQSAGVVFGPRVPRRIVRAQALNRAMMRNINQNLALTFVYNLIGIPIPAGVLLPDVRPAAEPMLASAAMSLNSVSGVSNTPSSGRSGCSRLRSRSACRTKQRRSGRVRRSRRCPARFTVPESPKRAAVTRAPRVLIVDDEITMAEMLAEGLAERGFDAVAAGSSALAAKRLGEEHFDALVTDLRMPALDGLGLVSVARQVAPNCPVIVMTAYSAVDTAIESIRRGAYHYLTKPFKVDELALFLERALDETRLRREAVTLKRTLKERFAVGSLVGRSGAMREVCDLVLRVADASAPVLILGETGTGKRLVARAVHAEGTRASAPFVTVNCAALPENLLESELFGHMKGAFTGATARRAGLFEEAHGGSLFLDEIGEMTPALQAKLLDVLERGVVRAVGSNKETVVDVRIIAATHRDLRERVSSAAFREDLLYRLEVVTIEIPPLRYRREDIPELIEHFLVESKARHPQSPVECIGTDPLRRLLEHSWPGNVRELEHVVERLVLLGRSPEVAVTDLPATLTAKREASPTFGVEVLPLREMQRRYVAWAFDQLGGRKVLTAEKLGVDIKTLGRWLRDDEEPPK